MQFQLDPFLFLGIFEHFHKEGLSFIAQTRPKTYLKEITRLNLFALRKSIKKDLCSSYLSEESI
jgi:hypothetical protein